MAIGFYDLMSQHHGDRESLTVGLVTAYVTWTSGTAYEYDPTTATFSLWSSGDKYMKVDNVTTTIDSTNTDVDAEMETVDIIAGNDILNRTTIDMIYMKTGIVNNNMILRKFTDFFTQENSNITDSIRLYNDDQEINTGVSTTIFGGSRSNIVHADIPLSSGDVKGFALKINISNEAQIHNMRILTLDNNIGGDR